MINWDNIYDDKFPELDIDKYLRPALEWLAQFPHIPGFKLAYDTEIETDGENMLMTFKNPRYEQLIYFEED